MNSTKAAFARVELVALLAAFALFLVITAPLLANSGTDSRRAVCFNNLRQLGGALQRWASDHDEHVPWFTFTTNGGTKYPVANSKIATPWIELVLLSNELSTARLLACPADNGAKTADNFTGGPQGFANIGFRANALSYTIQFDSDLVRPRAVLLMDRDFRGEGPLNGTCPQAGTGAWQFSTTTPAPQVVWTNAVHLRAGHLLFADGGVEFTDSPRLKQTAVEGDDNNIVHYAPPR
jgi:hypothetical protein